MLITGTVECSARPRSCSSSPVRTPIGGDVAGEHERGVAQRLAARELQLAGPQDHRVAAELDDPGLERHARAGRGLLEQQRHRAAVERARGRGRALEREGAVQQRGELAGREFGAVEEVHRVGAMRVLTWNLYHGRTVPPSGRYMLDEFSAALAGWEWDVALLQEVPPWWPPLLARAAGAQERTRLTSRNWLLPLRRWISERNPDILKSNGGGANAILVRGEILEHRAARLRRRPEARWVHGVRTADGWFVNVHSQNHPEALGARRHAGGGRARPPLGGRRAADLRRRHQPQAPARAARARPSRRQPRRPPVQRRPARGGEARGARSRAPVGPSPGGRDAGLIECSAACDACSPSCSS